MSPAVSEGLRIHFRDALAHWIGVGDWLRATEEWTGVAPEEALGALEGASPFSVGAIEYLDRIADVAKATPAALEALNGAGEPEARVPSAAGVVGSSTRCGGSGQLSVSRPPPA